MIEPSVEYVRASSGRILLCIGRPPHRRKHVQKIIRALALVYAFCVSDTAAVQAADHQVKPTIVLVHGAFAESSSWNAVIAELNRDGYRTIAAANPLRGVSSDAAAVSAIIGSIDGPVVLVGHSYGGPVITEAANGKGNVKALVYVAGFAPDTGESSLTLSGRFPGSTLGDALLPVALPDGSQDLYIQPEKFHEQFAADVSAAQASLMAATQRPVAKAALAEPSGAPSWKTVPSYAIYGSADRNIPPAVMKFMADRALSLKTVVVEGGSHALMVSHPDAVASLIEDAAKAD
jgi:pimeloyl-ACP methyl ester carboxylesterase